MKKMTLAILASMLSIGIASQANAQRHELVRGDMPPGMAAQIMKLSDRSLVGRVQPVQLVAPGQTVVELGDSKGTFFGAKAKQMSVAMALGQVYRFKLSNLPLPGNKDKTLYPSVEVIGKLNPPVGMENDFPVQVVLTQSDLALALNGQLVTRVIYLEDPRGPLPHRHSESVQPSFDITSAQDPLRAAERLGQPMAIVRLGSRVPLQNDAVEWFNFGNTTPTILPDPGQTELPLPLATKPAARQASSQVPATKNESSGAGPISDAKVQSATAVDTATAKPEETKVEQVAWEASAKLSWSPAPSLSEVEIADEKQTGVTVDTGIRSPNQLSPLVGQK